MRGRSPSLKQSMHQAMFAFVIILGNHGNASCKPKGKGTVMGTGITGRGDFPIDTGAFGESEN